MRFRDVLVAAVTGAGVASTVLRSRAVSENSAATNNAVPRVNTTIANRLSAVYMTVMSGWGGSRATCPAG